MTATTDVEYRRELGRYLAARGLDASLADGPVGDRYLARRAAGPAATPAEVFGAWFADALGGVPGEAESLGWIAFILAGGSGGELLQPFSEEAARALAARAPRPAFETPLAMPVQELRRARRSSTSGGAIQAPGAA